MVSVSEEYAECEASMVFQDTTLFMNFSIPQMGIKVKFLELVPGLLKVAVSPGVARKRVCVVIVWKAFARPRARKSFPHNHMNVPQVR
jgi:hypothetical protein